MSIYYGDHLIASYGIVEFNDLLSSIDEYSQKNETIGNQILSVLSCISSDSDESNSVILEYINDLSANIGATKEAVDEIGEKIDWLSSKVASIDARGMFLMNEIDDDDSCEISDFTCGITTKDAFDGSPYIMNISHQSDGMSAMIGDAVICSSTNGYMNIAASPGIEMTVRSTSETGQVKITYIKTK